MSKLSMFFGCLLTRMYVDFVTVQSSSEIRSPWSAPMIQVRRWRSIIRMFQRCLGIRHVSLHKFVRSQSRSSARLLNVRLTVASAKRSREGGRLVAVSDSGPGLANSMCSTMALTISSIDNAWLEAELRGADMIVGEMGAETGPYASARMYISFRTALRD
jgi:hypothetical protein